ncbi:MAG TPA: VOC family protein [Gammaproteobacteria bacterium]|jgi:catechol 2,3-dioxygenase-like lactoylglutathione lyase family enzyme|nr:VOC family protein [Gammaproteobacteria bacterium]
MQKPKPHKGLHHVALYSTNLEECVRFYTELLGMNIVWQPDPDNYYLSSGSDNFALHRAPADFKTAKDQRLDHIGFFLDEREEVDRWHEYLAANGVSIKAGPKDHRDGTRSFYCADPDGNIVQVIFIKL